MEPSRNCSGEWPWATLEVGKWKGKGKHCAASCHPPIPRRLGPICLEGSLWSSKMRGWSGSSRGRSISLIMEGMKRPRPHPHPRPKPLPSTITKSKERQRQRQRTRTGAAYSAQIKHYCSSLRGSLKPALFKYVIFSHPLAGVWRENSRTLSKCRSLICACKGGAERFQCSDGAKHT